MSNIRNFCIIAHIDHGKSTLADRMLEITWTVRKSDKSQILDSMELEQERGITIKLTPVRMQWKWHEFNLIDTPWHVDFQYEVSRSLAAVEWAILLVDASQWVQAQTLSTLYMALDYGLEIIPVLNKIDLPAANPERVAKELEHLIWVDPSEIIKVSWKTWENVNSLLDAVIDRIPTPETFKEKNLQKYWPGTPLLEKNYSRALIFDSVYDKYRGVMVYVKMVDWEFKAEQKLNLIHSENQILPTEVWFFSPWYTKDWSLKPWQIWYIVTWQKSVRDAKIWDTIIWLPKIISDDLRRLKEPKGDITIDENTNKITYDIIWAAMEVHKILWSWNREKNYELALIEELKRKWIRYETQVNIKLQYKNIPLANQFIDLIIEDEIIVELKSKWFVNKDNFKQLRSYLNSTNYKIWLLLDFWWESLIYKRLEKDYLPQSSDSSSEIQKYVIPWFKKIKPYVYAWVYPIDTEDFEKLREWFEKLSLNDSAIDYEYENSHALWHWFRCGFLGTLHMDIIKERLRREYDMNTIFTIPNVVYLIKLKILTIDKVKTWLNIPELIKSWMFKHILKYEKILENSAQELELDSLWEAKIFEKYWHILWKWLLVRSWADMPDPWYIDELLEPYAEVELVWPKDFSWNIMELAQEYRWEMKSMEYIDETRLLWRYEMPLWEIIIDFYDRLKSSTKGYATMNYEFKHYKLSDLLRLDFFINNERIGAFSMVVHKDNAYNTWKDIVEKLKELIPRHLFPIPLQAWVGAKIIARETIPAMKKDVLAKCYWWDVSRKRKLLDKQKQWKKKLKMMWKVNVPNDLFIKMVSR